MPRQRLVWVLLCLLATPVHADMKQFELHNHPNNAMGPPLYGLRIDDLLETGVYTFNFDYSDSSGKTMMTLDYDDQKGEIRIHGRAYGGKDIGNAYDPLQQGWVDIDFTYRLHVIEADNALGESGDDLFVVDEDLQNNGFIELLDWGGDQTFEIRDKSNSIDTFEFDNDWDHKQNAAFSGDPNIWSGTGWLQGAGAPAQDWSFWAEEIIGVPVESRSWTDLKRLYQR